MMKIIELNEIDSTQKYAISSLRNGDFKGEKSVLIYTKNQTAGVGRSGNKWLTQEGNVAMSVIYKIDDNAKDKPFSVIVGLLIAKFMKSFYNIDIKVKWPNDLISNGKKLGGVITTIEELNGDLFLIFGIGINLIHNPEGLEYETTNIFNECGLKIEMQDISLLLSDFIVNNISKSMKALLGNNLLYGIGKKVSISGKQGVFQSIDESGKALVLLQNGVEQRFLCDTMRFID